MSNISQFLKGEAPIPILATNFFSSRTWVAPQDGIVVIRAMGAGGGGARSLAGTGSKATGGYSGSWGAKVLRVSKGTSIAVAIGAGGVGRSGTDGDGTAGGDTTITVNGVTYIAYGGPGGKLAPATDVPNGPSPSANFDFGVASVKPGWRSTTFASGGAGVDILAQGNNATTSSAPDANGGPGAGGGTGGPGAGYVGGGAIGTSAATGQAAANPAIYVDASNGEWGISFYGGSGGSYGVPGANGGGGGGGSGGTDGGHGGGGAGATGGGVGGKGGIGAGGGAGVNGAAPAGGNGGNGFAHLKFYIDMRG